MAGQVQWLVDRSTISDLLHSFARALDTEDYATYVDNYAENGFIELPQPSGGTFVLQKAEMRTSGGWKFQHVKLTAVWLSGDPNHFNS